MGIKSIALVASTLVLSTSVNAGLIGFNDRIAFENYVSGLSTDNLNGIAEAHQPSFIRSDYTVTGSMYGCQNGIGCNGPYAKMEGDYIWTYETVDFSFSSGITAFGLDFDSRISKYDNSAFVATLNGLSSNVSTVGGFFGIATDDGSTFNNVEFSKNLVYGLFDNVTYTSSPISTVPVPAAAWLFGSGLIGLIGVARRKKS